MYRQEPLVASNIPIEHFYNPMALFLNYFITPCFGLLDSDWSIQRVDMFAVVDVYQSTPTYKHNTISYLIYQL